MLLTALHRPQGPPVGRPDPSGARRVDDRPNQLVVTLRSPAGPLTVAYVCHRGPGPRVLDARGMGLLTFRLAVG